MRASEVLVIAVGIGVAMASAFGCGSSSTGNTSGGTTPGTGGSGGEATTTSTGSGTTTTSSTGTTGSSSSATASSSSGAGGAPTYTCADCLDADLGAGAKSKECKAQGDVCFQNKNCVQIYNCVYFGATDKNGNPIGSCTTDAAGACCTFDCYQAIKDITGDPGAQQAIDAYEAMDQCTTCGVCKSACTSAPEYCDTYAMGAASCPK